MKMFTVAGFTAAVLILAGCGGGGGGSSDDGTGGTPPAPTITVTQPATFGVDVFPMTVDNGAYSYGVIYGGAAPEELAVDANGNLLFPTFDKSVEGTPQELFVCDKTTSGGPGIQCNHITSIRCTVTDIVYGSDANIDEVHCFLNNSTAHEKVFFHTVTKDHTSELYIGFQQTNSLKYLTNPIEYAYDTPVMGLF